MGAMDGWSLIWSQYLRAPRAALLEVGFALQTAWEEIEVHAILPDRAPRRGAARPYYYLALAYQQSSTWSPASLARGQPDLAWREYFDFLPQAAGGQSDLRAERAERGKYWTRIKDQRSYAMNTTRRVSLAMRGAWPQRSSHAAGRGARRGGGPGGHRAALTSPALTASVRPQRRQPGVDTVRKLIAFEGQPRDKKEIVVARADGTLVHRSTRSASRAARSPGSSSPPRRGGHYNAGIAWSPPAIALAFTSNGGIGNYDVYVHELAVKTTRAHDPQGKRRPGHWSPVTDQSCSSRGGPQGRSLPPRRRIPRRDAADWGARVRFSIRSGRPTARS